MQSDCRNKCNLLDRMTVGIGLNQREVLGIIKITALHDIASDVFKN